MRVRVAIEEAELRRIANESMAQQLKMLKEVMYRGYYTKPKKRKKKRMAVAMAV
jgi:hypothetical protein